MSTSGDRPHPEGAGRGRSNFKGPSSTKSGPYVSPKAGGSPWKYGREGGGKDYARKGSDYGTGATGPKKPSASVTKPLYAGNKDRRGD